VLGVTLTAEQSAKIFKSVGAGFERLGTGAIAEVVLLGRALLLPGRDMPNNSEKVMPINSESDTLHVTLGIILRDYLGDILRPLVTPFIRAPSELFGANFGR
jgi:hypothetical protein